MHILYCYELLLKKFGSLVYAEKMKINNFVLPKIFYDRRGSELVSLYKRNLKHYGINMSESEKIKLIKASTYIKQYNIKHILFKN